MPNIRSEKFLSSIVKILPTLSFDHFARHVSVQLEFMVLATNSVW